MPFGANSTRTTRAAPTRNSQAEVSEDGHYLIVTVTEGTDERNRLFYRDLTLPKAPMVELIPTLEAVSAALDMEAWQMDLSRRGETRP